MIKTFYGEYVCNKDAMKIEIEMSYSDISGGPLYQYSTLVLLLNCLGKEELNGRTK